MVKHVHEVADGLRYFRGRINGNVNGRFFSMSVPIIAKNTEGAMAILKEFCRQEHPSLPQADLEFMTLADLLVVREEDPAAPPQPTGAG